ncbi:MAG: MerR family transcriptional regulator [Proteobacteria bacterium]|nr:MerR family transcriptional regulator [Pseudomonadota bacterium]
MTKEFWTVTEVVEIFEVDERFLLELEEEEVLCPICRDDPPSKLFSSAELEKLRLAKILIDDMGVNLPGVEIILHMRQSIYKMRTQFDDILEDLAAHLRETLKKNS